MMGPSFYHLDTVRSLAFIKGEQGKTWVMTARRKKGPRSVSMVITVCINHRYATQSKERVSTEPLLQEVSLGSGDTLVDQDLYYYPAVLGPTCLSLVRCR